MTFPGWPVVLGRLTDGHDLGREGAAEVLAEILAGHAADAQIAGWIVAMRIKGETTAELCGLVDAMLNRAEPLEIAPGAIDIVGTGGAPSRRRHALSVSTMSTLVAAAAGARVCKHGNYKASATSGSFDTLAALGVTYDLGSSAVATCVERLGIGFVFARRFHPSMRHVGPVRAQLGIPTVFNTLGPLSNPARVRHHLIGVNDERMALTMAEVLAERGSERAWIVHGSDGLDEITTTGPTSIVELRDGVIGAWELDPTSYGIELVTSDDLAGGGPEENAAIASEVLGGSGGPRSEIVALNAAAALVIAGVSDELGEALVRARSVLASGASLTLLRDLIELSAGLG